MLDYYSLFSEYLAEQKPNSANTRESYLRDTLHFLEFLSETGVVPEQAGKRTFRGMWTTSTSWAALPPLSPGTWLRCGVFTSFSSSGDCWTRPRQGHQAGEGREEAAPGALRGGDQPAFGPARHHRPQGLPDKAMLELLYATGIRASELINLDIGDINLRSGVLYCRGNKGVRSIPVYPAAVVAVSDYIYRMRGLIAGPESGDALFVNLNGGRLTRQGFWKIVKGYAASAGITRRSHPTPCGTPSPCTCWRAVPR